MLQSWRQCSTYATSLNTLHYFGMLILAVFPRGRKSPDLYDNRKCRKNVQTVFYSDHAMKLEPNVFLIIYWNKVVPVHAMNLLGGRGKGSGVVAPLILQHQMRVIGHLHSSVTSLTEKAPRHPLNMRRSGSLTDGLDAIDKWSIPYSFRESNHDMTDVQPLA